MKAIYWALVSCYAVYYTYTLKVIIIFNRVQEILKCYHSNESYRVVVFVEEKKNWRTNRGILVHNSFHLKLLSHNSPEAEQHHQKRANSVQYSKDWRQDQTPAKERWLKVLLAQLQVDYNLCSCLMANQLQASKYDGLTRRNCFPYYIFSNNYCEIKLYKDVRRRDNKTYFLLSAFL